MTFGVLLSLSTNSQYYLGEDNAKLECTEQVNSKKWTDLIHYPVRMMMVAVGVVAVAAASSSGWVH